MTESTTEHSNEMNQDGRGSYAEVHGLKMYYEIHGTGKPLVLLPGGLMTIGMMGQILPELARTRQVIAVEVQGHGHTADIDRPPLRRCGPVCWAVPATGQRQHGITLRVTGTVLDNRQCRSAASAPAASQYRGVRVVMRADRQNAEGALPAHTPVQSPPSLNLSSTSRWRERSAWRSRRRSSLVPTR